MPGLLAIRSGAAVAAETRETLLDAINLNGTFRLHTWQDDDVLLALASPRRSDRDGIGSYDDEEWVVFYSGDTLQPDRDACRNIAHALRTGRYELLRSLNGVFAAIAYNKNAGTLHAISDRRAQQPLYWRHDRNLTCLSTHLSTFCRLPGGERFDPDWLWQYLYFNLSVIGQSFIKGVQRLPAASVLQFGAAQAAPGLHRYAGYPSRRQPLQSGKQGLERAVEEFSDRVPRYFPHDEPIACALTGGWDGRTLLALAPDDRDITTYTYGCPNCDDLTAASQTARALGLRHVPLVFDDAFVAALPETAMETVYLSCGQQGVLRSTLYFVYKSLTEDGTTFPTTVSGISLDAEFRGHGNQPSLVSDDVAALFRGNERRVDEAVWRPIVGSHLADLIETVSTATARLQDQYGPLADAETHLKYMLYEVSPKYFCGELAVADYFTRVRVPAWDEQLVALSFAIEQSALSYSQHLAGRKRGAREEMILQATILQRVAPQLFTIPVGRRRPANVLAGELPFQANRIATGLYLRLRDRLTTQPYVPPLEDWSSWLFASNREFVTHMLDAPDTRITRYISQDAVRRLVQSQNLHLVGKLLTVEMILRLMRNQWQRFW